MGVGSGAEQAVSRAAKAGAFLASPWLGGAVFVASTLYGLLRREPDAPDAFESTERLREARRARSAPVQWVLGRARTGGVTLFEADRQYAGGSDGGGAFDAQDTQKVRMIYTGHLLSDGPIGGVRGAWVDGLEVPLRTPVAAALAGGRSLESDQSAHNAALAAIRTRQRALVPNSLAATTNAVQLAAVQAADPVEQELWWELQTRSDALRDAQTWPPGSSGTRSPDGFRAGSGWRQTAGSQNWPAFVVSWGDGTAADSAATARALIRAGKVPYWRASNTMTGIGWAICEFRMWEREDMLYPWSPGSAPDVQLLVDGNPLYASATPVWGGNGPKFLAWYLREQCGVPASRLVDFDTAGVFCDTEFPAPAFTRTGAATEMGPVTGADLLARYYTERGSDLPSTAVQDRVLAELSARWGRTRARYASNGIISSDMSRDDVLASVAASFCGYVVEAGGTFYCRPGQARPPAATIGPGLLLGSADWTPDAGRGRHPNAVQPSIAQDRTRSFERLDMQAAPDSALVARDGAFVRRVNLPLVADEYEALRIAGIYVRRDKYSLARVRFAARADGVLAALVPGEILRLEADGFAGNVRAESALHARGVVWIEAVEAPDGIYGPEPPRAPPPGMFNVDVLFEDAHNTRVALAGTYTAP